MAVHYRGSPYHKRHPTRWGSPCAPVSKTACPAEVSDDEVVRVLEPAIEAAVAAGRVSRQSSGSHPRYVWGRSTFRTRDGRARDYVWEAEITNRAGAHGPEFKAYPVMRTRTRHAQEMPVSVQALLWPSDAR